MLAGDDYEGINLLARLIKQMLRYESIHHPLTYILKQVCADSCPTRFNFHCHTICSDGSLSPTELAKQALHLGLEHFAVTDHHQLAAHGAIASYLKQFSEKATRPTIWRGVEISCLLEGCLVHVLALGFRAHHPSLWPYLQGSAVVGHALRSEQVVQAIHLAGGLALLAHPARYRLPFQRLIAAAADQGFDGAEAWYDYKMKGIWKPTTGICETISSDLRARGLLSSCGTDTHGFELVGR